jgi:hypothetical protein
MAMHWIGSVLSMGTGVWSFFRFTGKMGGCIVRLHRRGIDVDLHEVARYDDEDLKSGGEVGVEGGKERILYILKKEWRNF